MVMGKQMFTYEGVEMTSLESMYFSKWLDRQDWSINTFIREDRLTIVNEWLYCYRNNIQPTRLENLYK